jgi:hypothetical protein
MTRLEGAGYLVSSFDNTNGGEQMLTETLSPRVVQLLEESRLRVLAEQEAARMEGLPEGETVTGLARMQSARELILAEGGDPDDADTFVAALARVPERDDDVSTVPERASEEEPEHVVGADLDRRARRLLAAQGEPLTERSYALALDVLGRRSS